MTSTNTQMLASLRDIFRVELIGCGPSQAEAMAEEEQKQRKRLERFKDCLGQEVIEPTMQRVEPLKPHTSQPRSAPAACPIVSRKGAYVARSVDSPLHTTTRSRSHPRRAAPSSAPKVRSACIATPSCAATFQSASKAQPGATVTDVPTPALLAKGALLAQCTPRNVLAAPVTHGECEDEDEETETSSTTTATSTTAMPLLPAQVERASASRSPQNEVDIPMHSVDAGQSTKSEPMDDAVSIQGTKNIPALKEKLGRLKLRSARNKIKEEEAPVSICTPRMEAQPQQHINAAHPGEALSSSTDETLQLGSQSRDEQQFLHTTSSAPKHTAEGNRLRGTVISFHEQVGLGHIRCPDGKTVGFRWPRHGGGQQPPRIQENVDFSIEIVHDKPCAVNVHAASEVVTTRISFGQGLNLTLTTPCGADRDM